MPFLPLLNHKTPLLQQRTAYLTQTTAGQSQVTQAKITRQMACYWHFTPSDFIQRETEFWGSFKIHYLLKCLIVLICLIPMCTLHFL